MKTDVEMNKTSNCNLSCKPTISKTKSFQKVSQAFSEESRTRFDISSSSDFPMLHKSSLTSSACNDVNKKLKAFNPKHNRRRIKPTFITSKRDACSTSAFNLPVQDEKFRYSGSNAHLGSSISEAKISMKHKSLLSARIDNSSNFERNADCHQRHKIQEKALLRTSVPFKPETDDRSNFHCDKAFFSFRKQRDMFYKLLREWDRTTDALSKEIIGQTRWLITQVKTQFTFDPFLRLFVDQLLNISKVSENGNSALTKHFPFAQFLNGDAEKFRLLENRVSKPSPSQNCNSCDAKYQEYKFFRDFVTVSDSYTFNVHLCDYLQSRMVQIENEYYQIVDVNDETDAQQYTSIVQAIHDLRLLGNFYGYVVFLPHQRNVKRRESLSHVEKACGEYLLSSLNRALKNGHLLLTIPWVVQLLCSSASVLTSTDMFSHICEMLRSIFRIANTDTSAKIPNILNVFIVTVISSLFEFEFFKNENLDQQLRGNCSSITCECPLNSVDAASSKILTNQLISEMHWPLAESKKSPQSETSPSKQQRLKKITPSTEKIPDVVVVQSTLETAFFRNQPLSLKRTVSFVSDRCHSNCVKYLLSEVLPQFCEECHIIKEFVKKESELRDNKAIKILANEVYTEALSHLKERAAEFLEENSLKCMNVLISPTVSKQVLQTATEIAERMAMKNVTTWLSDRLLDHIASNIKLILFDPQKRTNFEQVANSYHPAQISSIIHDLRERIINIQSTAGDTEKNIETRRIVFEQLSIVSQHLSSLDNTADSLPRHIMSVLAYLVRELVTFSESSDLHHFFSTLSIEDCQSSILLRLVEDF